MDSVGKLKEQVNDIKTFLSFSGLYGISREKILEMKKKIQELEVNIT